ncbi:hypothetical protein BPTFM16_02629 [Altererythrobacter insulae]|nr:hypothetical protein BPTFM16_02629 [Altererythrobacter insulae]
MGGRPADLSRPHDRPASQHVHHDPARKCFFAYLPPIEEASAVWVAVLMDAVNATLHAALLGGGAELRSWLMGANISRNVQMPRFAGHRIGRVTNCCAPKRFTAMW